MTGPPKPHRRLARIAIAAVLPLAWLPVLSQETFHSGGVGSCSGCHAMHDAGPASLLFRPHPTDVCLRCHETDNGNTWGSSLLAPGPIYGAGPFIFLLEDNLNDGPGGSDPTNYLRGHQAGHNVVSARKGTVADPDFVQSPGGSYPSSNLHCTSCHDPHGRGGHYRLLYGTDYPDAVVNGQTFTYTRPAPDAIGIPLDGAPESGANHNAYRAGVGRWCGNCHGDYHEQAGTGSFEHPSNRPIGSQAGSYNAYRGTGLYDGDGLTAYVPEVSVEHDSASTDVRGPVSGNWRLTCLSCHRAHASSAPRAGRWDFNIRTWAEEGVNSSSWPIPNPYASTVGDAQEGLCGKCHGPTLPPPPGPDPNAPTSGDTLNRGGG